MARNSLFAMLLRAPGRVSMALAVALALGASALRPAGFRLIRARAFAVPRRIAIRRAAERARLLRGLPLGPPAAR
jgi:hypothetical protein